MKQFKKILIANRSEIAVRINKSAKLLGIKTVAVYAEIERDALHTQVTDESFSLGNGELKDTYLNIDKIIGIAQKSNCDAIHPGYGFLAENPEFVAACDKANIVFIGPTAKIMQIMGNKIAARDFINKINVPTTKGIVGNIEYLLKESSKIPFPILIKAAAGGGGKGMRIVRKKSELKDALESTSREAKNYFSDGTVYIEQYIENPRHIEIQILGDNHGNIVHLFERECSIQRRFQKIIEESPSPTLTDVVRKKMGETAVKIGKEISYTNAGTIEFLVDKNSNYYFLEMNTRVQVEHPVTEMVTGVDIVKEQIQISAGNSLSFKQDDITQKGHAIECRIYAENPENNFIPSPGKMTYYHEPNGSNIRIDAGINKATIIESSFDPMISKLVVWADNREMAIQKSLESLNEYVIHGINTNISFLKSLLTNNNYKNNQISTHFCEDKIDSLLTTVKTINNGSPIHIHVAGLLTMEMLIDVKKDSIWNNIGYWRDLMKFKISTDNNEIQVQILIKKQNLIEFKIDDKVYELKQWKISKGVVTFELDDAEFFIHHSENNKGEHFITYNGVTYALKRNDILKADETYSSIASENGEDANRIFSPMPGKIVKINVKVGDIIAKGDNLIIVEAMKMENQIKAHKDAVIDKINVNVNDKVTSSTPLIIFEE